MAKKSKEGICQYCKKKLPWEWGGREDGCYVKHGCWGEVKAYLDGLDDHGLAWVRSRLLRGDHGTREFDILGFSQPVDWALCSKKLLEYFKITRADQISGQRNNWFK
jgi:hypothetical protein